MGVSTRWSQPLALAVVILLVPAAAQVVVVSLGNDTVTEGSPVEVCLVLFGAVSLTENVSVTLITNDSQANLNIIANVDYTPLRETFLFTPSGPSRQCVMLYTLRDNAVEDTEALNILVVNSSGIDVRPPLLHLNIRPANDKIVVDFVDVAYTVAEGEATVDLYVQLSAGSIERAFPSVVEVDFTTLDITTEGSADYVRPAGIAFSAGDPVSSVRRVQLRLREDTQVEGEETFHVAIVTSPSEMHLVTTSRRGVVAVTIVDNDVAAVELLGDPMTSVLEDGSGDGGSAVEICLKLVVDLPLDRNVIVSLDPEDVTTESSDYTLSEALLTFQIGSNSTTTVCGTLYIVSDGQEEEDEDVVVHAVPIAPDVTVGGVEKSMTITILNDDVNCEPPQTPSYPVVIDTNDGVIEGATTTYDCVPGFNIIVEALHRCTSGVWIGEKPICIAIDCGDPPSLENGDYVLANTTVNSTAVYFCVEGYHNTKSAGNIEIECLPSGSWSAAVINMDCVPIDMSTMTTLTGKDGGLGGKGIAAVVIGGLLVLVAAIVFVALLVVLWYLCYHGSHTRRSGKYVVDNSDMDLDVEDAKAMDTPNPLSPMQSEKENLPLYLEDDQYINMGISSPTDV